MSWGKSAGTINLITMVGAQMLAEASPAWLHALRSYLLSVTLLHAGWEILQLPLYTIWSSGNGRDIIFAVLHCTAGDAMIATFSLVLSLLVGGAEEWPYSRFNAIALLATLFGVGYTVYSEWHNTTVTQSWSYTSAMPTIFGIGLAPVAQWIVIPVVVFWRLHRRLAASP